MWITAALAAIQMISGLTSNSQKQAENRAKISGIGTPSSATVESVQRRRIKASATTTPGVAAETEMARQTSADIIGQATRTAKDSSKLSVATTKAGIIQKRAGQEAVIRGEAYKERAEDRLTQSLGQLGAEEQSAKLAKDRLLMEAETAKSNLLGAGVSNILTYGRDKEMMKFYSNLYGAEAFAA